MPMYWWVGLISEYQNGEAGLKGRDKNISSSFILSNGYQPNIISHLRSRLNSHQQIELLNGNFIKLYMEHLYIISFPYFFGQLTEMKYIAILDLSNNLLTNIPEFICDLRHLSYLDISKNQLIRLSNLSQSKTLTYLNVSNNQLHDIDSMGILNNLRILDISSNRIKYLPLNLHEFSYLDKLDVSNNCLETLPYNILHCPSLKIIKISKDDLLVSYNQELACWQTSVQNLRYISDIYAELDNDRIINFNLIK